MQISQLKYFMNFNLFEIATMTAEERTFYLEWFSETKRQENEAEAAASSSDNANSGPSYGPGV